MFGRRGLTDHAAGIAPNGRAFGGWGLATDAVPG